MRAAVGGILIVAALAGVVTPVHALSPGCAFVGPSQHFIDPAMVGVDQTPPNLPEPMVAEFRRLGDGSVDGGCDGSPTCTLVAVRLTNLATDDMTPSNRMGYRLTMIAGTGFDPPSWPVEPFASGADLEIHIASPTDDIDFTLEVVAIDLAGNESAPQTVRVHHEASGCSVGRSGSVGIPALAIAALLLTVAARRRRRRVRRRMPGGL